MSLRRLIALLAALAVSMLGLLAPGPAMAASSPRLGVNAYTNQSNQIATGEAHVERGVPCEPTPHTVDDAAERSSHGVSARCAASANRTSPAYITAGKPTQVSEASTTTPRQAQPFGVGSAALDALSPAIRSDVDDAIERASTGKGPLPRPRWKVYNNSDGLLPRGGNYTEWTAARASAKRGADRVMIEGDPANPNAIYYWDHVNPPVRVGP